MKKNTELEYMVYELIEFYYGNRKENKKAETVAKAIIKEIKIFYDKGKKDIANQNRYRKRFN